MASEVLGQIVGGLLGAAVVSLIGAIVLQVAARFVEKLDLTYGKAYETFFIAQLINLAIALPVRVVVGLEPSTIALTQLALLPVFFLVEIGVVAWRLAVPFGRAVLISLVMAAIGLGIAAAVVLVVLPFYLILT